MWPLVPAGHWWLDPVAGAMRLRHVTTSLILSRFLCVNSYNSALAASPASTYGYILRVSQPSQKTHARSTCGALWSATSKSTSAGRDLPLREGKEPAVCHSQKSIQLYCVVPFIFSSRSSG